MVRVFSEIDLYKLGVRTVGQSRGDCCLSSLCRAPGECSCVSPLFTSLLFSVDCTFCISRHCHHAFFSFFWCFLSFLPPLPGKEGWWVVEELALVFSYRTRFLMRNCFWWVLQVDLTALTNRMGRLRVRWGPQVC